MDELKSAEGVQEWLTRHSGLSWIAGSSLHLRAFYWGLYCGLGLDESERARRESVLVRMWADTMSLKPADDPFRLTELYAHVERLRLQLYRRIETGHGEAASNQVVGQPEGDDAQMSEPIEDRFKPLLDCIQSMDKERAAHRERIRCELEQARGAPPSEALRALDSLGGSFRVLAVGDRTTA